jgi:hypothetical protein
VRTTQIGRRWARELKVTAARPALLGGGTPKRWWWRLREGCTHVPRSYHSGVRSLTSASTRVHNFLAMFKTMRFVRFVALIISIALLRGNGSLPSYCCSCARVFHSWRVRWKSSVLHVTQKSFMKFVVEWKIWQIDLNWYMMNIKWSVQ